MMALMVVIKFLSRPEVGFVRALLTSVVVGRVRSMSLKVFAASKWTLASEAVSLRMRVATVLVTIFRRRKSAGTDWAVHCIRLGQGTVDG